MLNVIYCTIVQEVRKTHRNALVGLILNVFQILTLVVVFYVLFGLLGMRDMSVRGDFLLYIMSGIFMFVVFTKTMGAVVGAEGSASPIMQHAPMNTFVSISAAAMGAFYNQLLSGALILFLYHVIVTPISFDNPIGTISMFLLAWFNGAATGLVFYALKPWMPEVVQVVSAVYMRSNMFTSGKMFLANSMPATMLVFFTWNPLFHIIDQTRGFVFLNYNPHFSNINHPVYVGIALMSLGILGEYYTRRHASISWNATR